jgi:hypothetical protein
MYFYKLHDIPLNKSKVSKLGHSVTSLVLTIDAIYFDKAQIKPVPL